MYFRLFMSSSTKSLGKECPIVTSDFNVSYRGSKIIVNKDKDRNIHIIESNPTTNEPAKVWDI